MNGDARIANDSRNNAIIAADEAIPSPHQRGWSFRHTMVASNLRMGLIVYNQRVSEFVTRPIAAVLLLLAALMLARPLLARLRKRTASEKGSEKWRMTNA